MARGTTAYLVRRALFLIPLLIGLSMLMFGLIHAAPGDPVLAMLGERGASNPQFVEQARVNLGLDKPLPVQYVIWLGNLVQGDLGTAYTFNSKPVLSLIGERFWGTVQLQTLALALGCLIAVPPGSSPRRAVLVGRQRGHGRLVPRPGDAELLAGAAAPGLVGVELGWLPVISTGQAGAPYPERLKYFLLPVLVLAPAEHRLLRPLHALRDARGDRPGLRHHRPAPKGSPPDGPVPPRLRNALIPMVTVIGLQLPRVLGGRGHHRADLRLAGLGDLAYKAIGQRDYPVILAITMISGAAVMVVNLLTDVIYVLVDPRVSLTA
jgi:peptide/nickel transport system permease protein